MLQPVDSTSHVRSPTTTKEGQGGFIHRLASRYGHLLAVLFMLTNHLDFTGKVFSRTENT